MAAIKYFPIGDNYIDDIKEENGTLKDRYLNSIYFPIRFIKAFNIAIKLYLSCLENKDVNFINCAKYFWDKINRTEL